MAKTGRAMAIGDREEQQVAERLAEEDEVTTYRRQHQPFQRVTLHLERKRTVQSDHSGECDTGPENSRPNQQCVFAVLYVHRKGEDGKYEQDEAGDRHDHVPGCALPAASPYAQWPR